MGCTWQGNPPRTQLQGNLRGAGTHAERQAAVAQGPGEEPAPNSKGKPRASFEFSFSFLVAAGSLLSVNLLYADFALMRCGQPQAANRERVGQRVSQAGPGATKRKCDSIRHGLKLRVNKTECPRYLRIGQCWADDCTSLLRYRGPSHSLIRPSNSLLAEVFYRYTPP